jgi:hypothetical protein
VALNRSTAITMGAGWLLGVGINLVSIMWLLLPWASYTALPAHAGVLLRKACTLGLRLDTQSCYQALWLTGAALQ